MDYDICGNCQNFKPKPGQKFFTCTSAKHADLKYGMQVRPDTQSCDAFSPFKTPSKQNSTPLPTKPPIKTPSKLSTTPVTARAPAKTPAKKKTTSAPTPAPPKASAETKPTPAPTQEQPFEGPVQPVGLCRWGKVILVTALILIIALPSWLIYSCANRTTSVLPVPTPVPMPLPANATVKYFDIGKWAIASDRMILVSSPERISSYRISSGETYQAPPGEIFIFNTVTCGNIRDTPFSTTPGDFFLVDSEGHIYQGQTDGSYQISQRYPAGSLSPKASVSGRILWVVPISSSGLNVSYALDSVSTPPLVASWKLPW